MTRAKEKAERKAKATALANATEAGRSLRLNNEQEFLRLFQTCDVSLKFTCEFVFDGEDVECDLFSAACYGTIKRNKDDLAKLVVERMIAERVNLRVHRTDRYRFTTLMMAAMFCGREVVGLVLPFSDPAATATDGSTAAQLARAVEMFENAGLIEAFILAKDEAKIFEDDIPIPSP